MQKIYSYIHFPDSLDDYIDCHEKGKSLVKDLRMSIDLIDCEKGSVIYYSKSNKIAFFESLEVFDEVFGYFGGIDFKTLIDILFQEAEIIPINESFQTPCNYSIYNSNTTYLDRDFPLIFLESLSNLKRIIEPDKLIILNMFNNYFSNSKINIIEDCNEMGKKIFELPFVENFKQLDDWLIENRIQRNYNMSDNRHIENHPQSQINSHNKSPLINGLGGKENASKLLINAIGDKRVTKDLINWDSNNQSYIWYEYENENPSNQYHGYHLVKAYTHEKDSKAIEKIPERTSDILNYREVQNP